MPSLPPPLLYNAIYRVVTSLFPAVVCSRISIFIQGPRVSMCKHEASSETYLEEFRQEMKVNKIPGKPTVDYLDMLNCLYFEMFNGSNIYCIEAVLNMKKEMPDIPG